MKFALNTEYGNYNSKNRILAFTGLYDYFKNKNNVECKFHVNALILTTKDFDIKSELIQIVSDSCSVQYRPKGLHKNSKGIFYKLNGKSIYLYGEQNEQLSTFIKRCITQKELILNNERN